MSQLIEDFVKFGQELRKKNQLIDRTLMFAGSELRREQWFCLHFLIDHPGIAPALLAEKIAKDRASITSLLDGLEKKKVITRTRDPLDARKIIIEVTDLGYLWHSKSQKAVLAALQ
jgi:DNA-binding MarR family transcriptional regulator